MKTSDLAKGISFINDNVLSLPNILTGVMIMHPDENNILLKGIVTALREHPEQLDPFAENSILEAFSKGQIDSKQWLVDTIIDNKLDLGAVFICAGWYGTLAAMILDSDIDVDFIRSFDKDSACAEIADTINRRWVKDNWKFKASTVDIMDINYEAPIFGVTKADGVTETLGDHPHTVINTSCEHFLKEDFNKWYRSIPDGCLIILQSNNYKEINEHVNCVSSLNEFKTYVMFDELVFEGELQTEKYIRYMLIGYK